MTLPINRTALIAAQTNQVPNMVLQSALNIAAIQTPYDTIDELNIKVDANHAAGNTGSTQLADGSVIRQKIAAGAVGATQLDPTLLTDYGDIAVQAEFDRRGIDVMKYSNLVVGIDWTAAIQAAATYATNNTVNFQPTGGSYLGTIPVVILPKGHYIISDEITIGDYARFKSDDGAIIEQITAGKKIFVNATNAFDIRFQGISFIGGTNAIYLSNANVDQTMYEFHDCEFHLQTNYAVYTMGLGYPAAPTDYHMSANISFRKCRFRTPNKILHNVCDSATLDDCWVFVNSANSDDNAAVFKNLYGDLHFRGMFGVPSGMNSKTGARWIDNYNGSFYAIHSRFGNEDGGMPIVYHMGDRVWESVNPYDGSSIVFQDSICYCGPAANPNTGIVCFINSIPKYVRIQGSDVIRYAFNNVGGLNLTTYFTNPLRLYRFVFQDNNKISGIGVLNYPELLPYVTYTPNYDENKIMLLNNSIGINEVNPQRKLHLSADQTDDNMIRFEKINTAILLDYVYGGMEFYGRDQSASASGIRGSVSGIAEGTTGGIGLVFKTAAPSTTTLTERFRIDGSGIPIVAGDRIRIVTAKTPASATATGVQGDICWDSSYFYICIATNTWHRTAHATW